MSRAFFSCALLACACLVAACRCPDRGRQAPRDATPQREDAAPTAAVDQRAEDSAEAPRWDGPFVWQGLVPAPCNRPRAEDASPDAFVAEDDQLRRAAHGFIGQADLLALEWHPGEKVVAVNVRLQQPRCALDLCGRAVRFDSYRPGRPFSLLLRHPTLAGAAFFAGLRASLDLSECWPAERAAQLSPAQGPKKQVWGACQIWYFDGSQHQVLLRSTHRCFSAGNPTCERAVTLQAEYMAKGLGKANDRLTWWPVGHVGEVPVSSGQSVSPALLLWNAPDVARVLWWIQDEDLPWRSYLWMHQLAAGERSYGTSTEVASPRREDERCSDASSP